MHSTIRRFHPTRVGGGSGQLWTIQSDERLPLLFNAKLERESDPLGWKGVLVSIDLDQLTKFIQP